jgi:hypothetical protein
MTRKRSAYPQDIVDSLTPVKRGDMNDGFASIADVQITKLQGDEDSPASARIGTSGSVRAG